VLVGNITFLWFLQF